MNDYPEIGVPFTCSGCVIMLLVSGLCWVLFVLPFILLTLALEEISMDYDPYIGNFKIGLGCAIPLLMLAIIIACILSASVWFLVH